MGRITARACDHCGALGTPVADNARRLPTGWLYVTTSKAESRELCSWRCVYLSAQGEAYACRACDHLNDHTPLDGCFAAGCQCKDYRPGSPRSEATP